MRFINKNKLEKLWIVSIIILLGATVVKYIVHLINKINLDNGWVWIISIIILFGLAVLTFLYI